MMAAILNYFFVFAAGFLATYGMFACLPLSLREMTLARTEVENRHNELERWMAETYGPWNGVEYDSDAQHSHCTVDEMLLDERRKQAEFSKWVARTISDASAAHDTISRIITRESPTHE